MLPVLRVLGREWPGSEEHKGMLRVSTHLFVIRILVFISMTCSNLTVGAKSLPFPKPHAFT